MAEKTKIIELKNCTVNNSDTPVIYEMTMEVESGDFIYLTGKVGTGKTSIIRSIIAQNKISGEVATVLGHDLMTMKEKDIPVLRKKIGVVFQDFQLLMDRSVYDNLLFVLKSTSWKDKLVMDTRITDVLREVGMETKAHKMPYQLSGGEQQRIAIARALLNSPGLILADEPTGNLDNETAEGIMNLLCKINRENDTAVIIVTHNSSLLEKYPGRVFVCADERCTERMA